METKQTTAKTSQQYLIGHALYITGPSQISRLPMAVAPSHKPWHKPTMWRGAIFETNDKPSGEMKSYATVRKKSVTISTPGVVFIPILTLSSSPLNVSPEG